MFALAIFGCRLNVRWSIVVACILTFSLNAGLSQPYPPTNCGSYTPTVTIPAGSTVAFSTLGLPTTVSSASFLVNADLLIDVSTQAFYNCSFKVAAGKKIIIKNDFVRFWRCNLWSCGSKWEGIDIQDDPNKIFYLTECNIENAIKGINIDNRENLYFNVDVNNFYNNYIGINIVGNSNPGAADFNACFIYSNKFHGDNYSFDEGFPPPYTLPSYGIKVLGSIAKPTTLYIGYFTDSSPSDPNEFYNLYIAGVDAVYSNVYIKGSKFYNFWNPPPTVIGSLGSSAGSGIRQFEGYVIVQSYNMYSTYPRVSFNNLNYGIYAHGDNQLTTALDCSFSSCATYAIYTLGTPECNLNADDNTFVCNQSTANNFYDTSKRFNGIGVFGAGKINIDRNSFNSNVSGTLFPLNSSYQVIAQGYASSTTPFQETYFHLNDNRFFNSHHRATCALISNYEKVIEIDRNYFSYSVPTNYVAATGLKILDCRDGSVRDNLVDDTHFNDAFHIQRVSNKLFCTNRIVSSTYGFHALDINNIDLAKTAFGTHQIGLYLEQYNNIDPIIGLQYFKENTWCTNGSLYSAKNEAIPAHVGSSEFHVNSTMACHYPMPIFPNIGWFNGYITGSSNTCESQVDPFTGLGQDAESMTWSGQYEWYKTISTRSPVNEYEAELMEYALSTSIPALSSIENQIAGILANSHEMLSVIDTAVNQINSLQEARAAYIAQLNGIPPTSSQMLEIAGYADAIQVASDNISGIIQAEKTDDSLALNAIIPSLESVTVYNEQDQAYKSLLQLRLDAALASSDDTSYYQSARALTSLDESVYGCAVGKAHYYLPQEELFGYFDDITNHCIDGHPEEIAVPEHTTTVQWKVIRQGDRLYNITMEGNECGHYGVFDMSGRLMTQGSLSPGVNSIRLNSLTPGYYIIKGDLSGLVHRILISN